MKRVRSGRRLRAALLGVALALVALEVAMQIAAYAAWRSGDGFATRAVTATHRILCVGDSFTFGLGASPDRGYPQQLEALLKGEGLDVAVVNGGKPGQDSADVLRRLPAQLDVVRPTQVLVLAGYNDRWSHPRPVDERELATAESHSFPLRVRTVALLARIAHALFGGDPARTGEPLGFLGAWHAGDFEIELRADGSLRVGERTTRWELAGDELLLALELESRTRARWSVAGDRLTLELDGRDEPMVFTRGAVARRAIDRARVAYERRDVPAAQAIVGEGLAVDADDVELLALRAELAVASGQDPAADVARLSDAAKSGGEREVTALVEALLGTGRADEGVASACEWLRDHPRESRLWWVLTRHVATAQRTRASIVAALDAALPRIARDEPWRAALLRLRAGVLRNGRRDPVASLANTIEAALVDGDKAHVVSWLQSGEFTAAHADAAVESLALDEAARARVATWRAEAASGESGPSVALALHLRRIAALCRAQGAVPYVLTYPEDLGKLERAIRGAAVFDDIALIDCEAEFDAELRGVPRSELFVGDGHCNDRGYGVVARCAANALRSALR